MIQFDSNSSLIHKTRFPDEITMCCWVYPYELKVTLLFGVLGAMVFMLPNGTVRNGIFGGYDRGPAIERFKWTHITCTANRTTGLGYMWYNGEAVVKGENHTYTVNPNYSHIEVGNVAGYTYPQFKMNGVVNDFRMYGRYLEESEIQTIIESDQKDFIIDDLTAWLPCDEPVGPVTRPLSLVNQDATDVTGTPQGIVRERTLREVEPIEITPIVGGTV